MPDPSLDTLQLHDWLDRMRAGDSAARDALLRTVSGRLERLASKMLRRFPAVARFEQTGDVLQNAILRLLRALREVQPVSVRAFFGLAAEQMRRELLDLARHYQGPLGMGANQVDLRAQDAEKDAPLQPSDPADGSEEVGDLERWAAFHKAVERLPAEEREVVGLAFYHGWTQEQIAELFQVSGRTVGRRWQSACLRLHTALGELWPEGCASRPADPQRLRGDA